MASVADLVAVMPFVSQMHFKDYDGKVSEVDSEKGRVKVTVPIFGRDTVVELDSLQVKKL